MSTQSLPLIERGDRLNVPDTTHVGLHEVREVGGACPNLEVLAANQAGIHIDRTERHRAALLKIEVQVLRRKRSY